MAFRRIYGADLVAILYRDLFGEAPWDRFLSELRLQAHCDRCGVLMRRGGAFTYLAGGPIDPVNAHLGRTDHSHLTNLRADRVYSGQELGLGPENFLRVVRMQEVDGPDLLLWIARSRSDLRAQDAALLDFLAPLVLTAVIARIAHEREQRRGRAEEQARGGLGIAWILTDCDRFVLDADRRARRWINEGQLLWLGADNRLRFRSPKAEAMLELGPALPTEQPQACWLSTRPPLQMMITAASDQYEPLLGSSARFFLIRHVLEPDPQHPSLLASLFGLSSSEAKLALHVARGLSLQDAGDTMGLTQETTRNYSKRLYAKTGARGQVDLVRTILNGINVLAPNM
ncbi:hypothetical protein LWE61_16135 [Sphingobium sufflavum]|uniref:helix-turn-helix transcriptional regulator n=1 Tax=Sphingobium sufflavum TaxID=1129547 RepID=UPI001F2338DF|nr:hypothetical protein [Sphingobium sufflavum]MCE7798077.1 hypothetical protein [Sphingobium sufflavum]